MVALLKINLRRFPVKPATQRAKPEQ